MVLGFLVLPTIPFTEQGEELVFADLVAKGCFVGRGDFLPTVFQPGLDTTGRGMTNSGAFWEYTLSPTSPSVSLLYLQKSLHS